MPMSKTLVREIGAMIKNHLDAIKKLRNMRKLVLTSYGPEVKSKKKKQFYQFMHLLRNRFYTVMHLLRNQY